MLSLCRVPFNHAVYCVLADLVIFSQGSGTLMLDSPILCPLVVEFISCSHRFSTLKLIVCISTKSCKGFVAREEVQYQTSCRTATLNLFIFDFI